jgi:hypothetical protein
MSLEKIMAQMPGFILEKHGNGNWTATWKDYADKREISVSSRTSPEFAVRRLHAILVMEGILFAQSPESKVAGL